MISPEQLKEILEKGLEEAAVQVEDLTGDSNHYRVQIVSPAFDGKNLVARHRLVYATLGDLMKEEIHALALQTKTPAETGSTTG